MTGSGRFFSQYRTGTRLSSTGQTGTPLTICLLNACRLLMDNFYEMAPIIYTPTVGWACSHFSHLYRRPRGMYFCKYDRGEMASMVYNWESDEVDAVVVTDGSRVLGLGDLGIGGLGISIGKLDLYVAAGGFHPR